MSVVIVSLLSLLSKYTSVIPNVFSDYLHSGYARFFSGKNSNALFIFIWTHFLQGGIEYEA